MRPDTHHAQLKYGRGKKLAGKIALTQKGSEEEVKKSRKTTSKHDDNVCGFHVTVKPLNSW
jgi:hypothetical protein